MSRPKAIIDWELVDKMTMAGNGGTTISRALGIDEETLYRACKREHKMGFSEYRQQKIAIGSDRLLSKGYQMAVTGDRTMLIFYLKNRCGFTDRVTTESNINISKEAEEQVNRLLDDVLKARKELDG